MRGACSYTPMIEEDLDEIISIERNIFIHPWSKDFFRLIISDINNYVITLKQGCSTIGYGGYHLLRKNSNFLLPDKSYHQLIHLINIAIKPSLQNRGYGTFLMNTLLNNARSKHSDYCYLEVRPSNSKALSFYKHTGFSIIGIIENYYPQESENAFVMGRELSHMRGELKGNPD